MKKPPIVALVAASLLTAPLFAQSDAEEDEIFELTPFTVDGSEDTGYRAKHSLSGSRMKISLDDITVPIDVITPEMMEDFNINEQEDMFDIVSNMEPRGDDFLSGVYESGASYQIRGFVGVKSLRNFAASNMPFDRYNSTRFIASKGPNAILFGSGPGGGSVSFFTKRYNIGSKDRTNLKFTVDSFGGTRGEITGSKTLIEDKLGIFYGAFDDKKEYDIEPSYQQRDGVYFSTTYRPFENTLITGSIEVRDDNVFRPASNISTLTDYHNAWDEFGNPAVLGTGVNNRRSDLLFPDGTVMENQAWRSWGVEQFGNNNDRLTVIDGQIVNTKGGAFTDRPRDTSNLGGQRSFPVWDWNPKLGPTGLNGGAEANNRAVDFNLEQKLTDDLYLMAAYGKTDSTRLQYQHRFRQLYKDPNYYLPDGVTENPHFGEYYLEHGNYNFLDRSNVSETMTATLAYELDLEERNKYLGKHNFAIMHSAEEVLNTTNRQSMILTDSPDPDFNYDDVDVDLGIYKLYLRHYLGDDLSTLTADDMFPDYRYIHDGPFTMDGYTWTLTDGVGRPGWRQVDTTSNMFVAQSNFFRSRLITSFGYREENVDQFVANFGQNPDSNDQYFVYEHYTKEQADDPNFTPVLTDMLMPDSKPDTVWDSVSGISRNVGAVFKLTPNIALVGNAASNISGSPGRVGLFAQAMPNSAGESEDYGVRFNLLDNKLRIEYTRYSTATTNQALQSGRMSLPAGDTRNIWKMMLQNGHPGKDVFEGGENWDVRDFRSRGHELTLSGSPIKGLSLRLAASYNEQVATNVGSVFMGWWAENGADIEAFALANPNMVDAESSSSNPETAESSWEDIVVSLAAREGQEGIPNINKAMYTAKFLGKYRFRDGALKGHETGLNIAWRGKMKTSFFENADRTRDYDRPFWTDPSFNTNFFWNYSKKIKVGEKDVNWKVQVNVSNLFNTDNYTPRNFFYAVRGDDTSELLYNQISIKEPRKISLTNSFSF